MKGYKEFEQDIRYIIFKPNIWFDRISDLYRFLIMIGLYLGLIFSFGYLIGFFIFALVGSYRILYHIFPPKKIQVNKKR